MPDSITIVIWNVETFGQARRGPRGNDYAPLCNFMARALHEANADIFIMQELVQAGEAYLGTLRDALDTEFGGNTWRYDYIKGSVTPGVGRNAVVSEAQLAYRQRAHLEGYALFWRTGQPTFTMLRTRESLSHGTDPGNVGNMHALSLVMKGRNIQNPVLQDDDKWFTAAVYNGNTNTINHNLDFIANDAIHLIQPQLDDCRRPCYCVVELNITAAANRADRLLPIVVFHTPVNGRVASAALQAGSFSQPLYQVDDTVQPAQTMVQPGQAIIGGDFNLDIDDGTAAMTRTYAYITNAWNNSGAGCSTRHINYGNTDDNKTAYRWKTLNNRKIVSDDLEDYLGDAIDHAFIRPSANVTFPTPTVNKNYNLLEAVTGGNTSLGNLVSNNADKALIKAFWTSLDVAAKAGKDGAAYRARKLQGTSYAPCLPASKKRKVVDDPNGDWQSGAKKNRLTPAGFLIPNVKEPADFNQLKRQLKKGYFDRALGATQFVRQFISDHAPIVIKVEFN